MLYLHVILLLIFSYSYSYRYSGYCDSLMETVQKMDSLLHAELTSEIQKELNLELNRLRTGQKKKDVENVKVRYSCLCGVLCVLYTVYSIQYTYCILCTYVYSIVCTVYCVPYD